MESQQQQRSSSSGGADHGLVPIANVGRLMKRTLPSNAKVSKAAKQTMQECATEFISFVTAEASDKCHRDNRKTLNGDDICWALTALGFDAYADAIIAYLRKYREFERETAAITTVQNSTQTLHQRPDLQLHHHHHHLDHHHQAAPPPPNFHLSLYYT